VLRAIWPEDTLTGRELLAVRRAGRGRLTNEETDRVEALKRRDVPPEDKWAGN
jgi:hypothetical protein